MKLTLITRGMGRVLPGREDDEAGIQTLRLDGRSLGLTELYSRAGVIRRETPDKTWEEAVAEALEAVQGNVEILRVGEGGKAEGFIPNSWVFIVRDVAYQRIPGCGDRGQHYVSGGRWHTRVRRLGRAATRKLKASRQYAVQVTE